MDRADYRAKAALIDAALAKVLGLREDESAGQTFYRAAEDRTFTEPTLRIGDATALMVWVLETKKIRSVLIERDNHYDLWDVTADCWGGTAPTEPPFFGFNPLAMALSMAILRAVADDEYGACRLCGEPCCDHAEGCVTDGNNP